MTTADQVRRDIWAHVHQWVLDDHLAREDGFVYAVDMAQLLSCAVRETDRDVYLRVRQWAIKHLVVDRPDDEFTRGFVLWRRQTWPEGGEPSWMDSTGTTETLRLAEGLWEGGKRFNRPEDRDLAVQLLHGYARHATVEHDVWYIQNYFKLSTRHFSTNTFLVDYDPDFVARVAKESGDAKLREVAEKSYELVRRSVAPSGLIYDLVQPEVFTLTPNLECIAFSPNDVVQVSNACTVALRCTEGAPEVGRGILRFAWARRHNMTTHYLGRTGEPAPKQPVHFPGSETWAGLTILALRLGDTHAAPLYEHRLLAGAAGFAREPFEPRLYMAAELVAALQVVSESQTDGKDRADH